MDKETGFLNKYLGGDAKVIAETRFLGEVRSQRFLFVEILAKGDRVFLGKCDRITIIPVGAKHSPRQFMI